MNTEKFGGTGHGMPEPVSPEVAKRLMAEETTTTTIHESKHFPFQIVEITTTKRKTEIKQFRIGMLGEFVSAEVFLKKETAEKYISSRPWELITNLVCLTFKNALEYEKSKS